MVECTNEVHRFAAYEICGRPQTRLPNSRWGPLYALALDPHSAYIHDGYGILYLTPLGRFEEAIAEVKHALAIDPLTVLFQSDLGWVYAKAGRWAQSIAPFQKALEMEPGFGHASFGLGLAYGHVGRYDQAIAAMQRGIEVTGGMVEVVGGLGWAYAIAGRRDDALKIAATLRERAKQEYIDALSLVHIYMGLGDKDQAFEWLQKAIDERCNFHSVFLKTALFDSLRSDPRFKGFLHQVGLE